MTTHVMLETPTINPDVVIFAFSQFHDILSLFV